MKFRFITPSRALLVGAALLGSGIAARTLTPATPAQAQAPTTTVQLYEGCNNVALTWNVGTTIDTVAAAVTPASSLDAVWKYDNAQARFYGFSTLPGAPNDYSMIEVRLEPVYICMKGAGQIDRPTI